MTCKKPARIALIVYCSVLIVYMLSKLAKLGPIGHNASSEDLEANHEAHFNESKVALLIENRSSPNLAPLLLHMISVVPQDWRFRFMGSRLSVAHLNRSVAIRHQVDTGKLDLTYIPKNMSTSGQEMISRFLTTPWIYDTVLAPAEWLLIFQTDSIMCANSRGDLNDWLEYDWVGAPWSEGARYGGNGGLSLRRVSAISQILQTQRRLPQSTPEDVWLTERLAHRPGARIANGTVSRAFSAELQYYDYPMGYHTGGSGSYLFSGLWGTPGRRQHMYDYCPEIKFTLDMDAAIYMGDECDRSYW
ncbi:MAG: hypothetical protein M1827_001568 [Pycnora praestabilis]|nr:MAG: hypothetical protein M1827_001568 [Pycnora praestabilis]